MKVKYAVLAAMIGVCLCGTPRAADDYESLAYCGDNITKILPSNWKLVEKKAGELPSGHYWGMKFDGPRGLLLVFEGNRDVFMHWEDKSGSGHQEALGKEALSLWIMPPEYAESWKRFFVMKRPIPAELIYSGAMTKIYGNPGHHLSPEAEKRFNEILLTNASSTSWPDSPKDTLTWATWKEDIRMICQAKSQ